MTRMNRMSRTVSGERGHGALLDPTTHPPNIHSVFHSQSSTEFQELWITRNLNQPACQVRNHPVPVQPSSGVAAWEDSDRAANGQNAAKFAVDGTDMTDLGRVLWILS